MSTLSTCTQLLPHRGVIGKSLSKEEKLPSSGQVLKFYCVWEQHKRVMGRKAPILLLYFPTDDTIELRQLLPASTPETILAAEHSHLPYPVILKRQRVAKYEALMGLPLPVRVCMSVLEPFASILA